MAADTQVLFNGNNRYVVKLMNFDGTAESDVVKVDISTLIGPDGKTVPTSFSVEGILYDVQGFSAVKLEFDASTDDPFAVLSLAGYMDLRGVGGIIDPKSSGYTGDILLTTVAADSGYDGTETYDITLFLRKRQ